MDYKQLPDSTRLELRMKAHLLFQAAKVDTEVLQKSLDAGIPVALNINNKDIKNLSWLLTLCLQKWQSVFRQ